MSTDDRRLTTEEVEQANCRGTDLSVWFEEISDSVDLTALALRTCQRCDIRPRCLEANLDAEYGIFAGTTASERRAIRAVMTTREEVAS